MSVTRVVTISTPLGMHARAAARFARAAGRFSARITVTKDARSVDGKSILGLLLLSAACGAQIEIAAEGPDEQQAVARLGALVDAGFEEPPTAPSEGAGPSA